MKDTYIPQYLDAPERYLFFTKDEVAAVVLPVMISTMFLSFGWGLLLGALSFWSLRKFKKGTSLKRIIWAMYWLLPGEVFRLKATPPAHLRELAG